MEQCHHHEVDLLVDEMVHDKMVEVVEDLDPIEVLYLYMQMQLLGLVL
jgi:hypothetical protein